MRFNLNIKLSASLGKFFSKIGNFFKSLWASLTEPFCGKEKSKVEQVKDDLKEDAKEVKNRFSRFFFENSASQIIKRKLRERKERDEAKREYKRKKLGLPPKQPLGTISEEMHLRERNELLGLDPNDGCYDIVVGPIVYNPVVPVAKVSPSLRVEEVLSAPESEQNPCQLAREIAKQDDLFDNPLPPKNRLTDISAKLQDAYSTSKGYCSKAASQLSHSSSKLYQSLKDPRPVIGSQQPKYHMDSLSAESIRCSKETTPLLAS